MSDGDCEDLVLNVTSSIRWSDSWSTPQQRAASNLGESSVVARKLPFDAMTHCKVC